MVWNITNTIYVTYESMFVKAIDDDYDIQGAVIVQFRWSWLMLINAAIGV